VDYHQLKRCSSVFFVIFFMAGGVAIAANILAGTAPQRLLPLDKPARQSIFAAQGVLLDALVLPSGRALAVGERGHVVFSDNPSAGEKWVQATVPVSITLTAVTEIPGGGLIAVGHGLTILDSQDNGKTWHAVTDGRKLAGVFRQAAAQAMQAGNQPQADKLNHLADEAANKPLLDVVMVNANDGLAVGAYGVILATHDAGKHWFPESGLLKDNEDRHLNAIRQVDGDLWIAGERGLLYQSTDGGRHFSEIHSPSEATFFTIVGAGETVIAAGLRGKLILSTDKGQSWRVVETGITYSFTAALFDQSANAFILADDSGGFWRIDAASHQLSRYAIRASFPVADIALDSQGNLMAFGLLGMQKFSHALLAATVEVKPASANNPASQ
jgi:photosystem II stability/assembly factor-like uncharacterized protein